MVPDSQTVYMGPDNSPDRESYCSVCRKHRVVEDESPPKGNGENCIRMRILVSLIME